MRGIPPIRMPQTEQMALGSAFDAFIKTEIAVRLDLPEAEKRLASLLKNVDREQQAMIPEGNKVCQEYIEDGCLDVIMEEGMCDVELLFGTKDEPMVVSGIPIFGFPDGRIIEGPLDWKVSGWGSSRARSPKPGYQHYTKGNKQHVKYGIPMHEIDRRWATQLFFYNLLFDGVYDAKKEYWGAIDQIIVGQGVASYRTSLGHDFTVALWADMICRWDKLQAGDIEPPAPNLWKCEPYGNARTCTVDCDAYQAILGDPISRAIAEAK
jgi:hypothetical protein